MDDYTLTMRNAEYFCMLLCNRLPNLKNVSFCIYESYGGYSWKRSHGVNGKNESTKLIIKFIRFLVDHLQQLLSLCIFFSGDSSHTSCFPYLIRRELNECPLSRPCRLRCFSEMIHIWL